MRSGIIYVMQVKRKAHLLHVTGRSSVGGVSVEGWWSPIYQLDLPLSAVQRWPAGGPTLPDRGAKTDEELRRRNLGRGLLISIVTALLTCDVNYAPTSFRYFIPLNPFKVGSPRKYHNHTSSHMIFCNPMLIINVVLSSDKCPRSDGMSQFQLINLALFRDSTFLVGSPCNRLLGCLIKCHLKGTLDHRPPFIAFH